MQIFFVAQPCSFRLLAFTRSLFVRTSTAHVRTPASRESLAGLQKLFFSIIEIECA